MEPDTAADPQIPVYPSAIIGWRVWLLVPGPKLYPINGGSLRREDWRSGIVRAECLNQSSSARHTDQVPAEDCECGFHAYYERERAEFLARENEISGGPSLRDGLVMGVICAWGGVRLHREGFRAEYAQIHSLLIPDHLPAAEELAEGLSERYGALAVHSAAQIDAAARELASRCGL